ncbi:MAG: hypothetical protein ACE5HF_07920 [Gemmatimonadota bacterium]
MWNRIRAVLVIATVAVGTAACSDTVGPAASGSNATFASGRGGGVQAAGGGGGGEQRIEARLSATGSTFAKAKGKARFRDRGGEAQLQIEVENLAPGLVVDFLVDGASAGQATTDAFGDARLSLNSDLGDIVPAVSGGTTVEAQVGGTTVAAGSFGSL